MAITPIPGWSREALLGRLLAEHRTAEWFRTTPRGADPWERKEKLRQARHCHRQVFAIRRFLRNSKFIFSCFSRGSISRCNPVGASGATCISIGIIIARRAGLSAQ